MKTELILKSICQVLGIFPINVKGTTFTISKLYLASSYLVLFYLISVIVLFLAHLQNDNNGHNPCGVLIKLGQFMFFMKICGSIVAITSNIVYRHKNVKFYNKLMTLASWDQYTGRSTFKISGTINLVVMIAISFLCLQRILTFLLYSISNGKNFEWYIVYSMFIEFPVFFDIIVICRLCIIMSNCHRQVKEQITNIYATCCTEKPDSNTHGNNIKIISNSIIGPKITQKKIIPNMSKLVGKLEHLRHTSFELFQMHMYFLSSRQFQLFLLFTEILLEVMINVYTLLLAIAKNLGMSALCYSYMVVAIMSKLISLFMLCYYNGKVFQEGQDTKHILQKIRALSLEREFVISTNAFVSQIKGNKQYKICGLSSLDMSFPIKILEYVVNYILVFVQFLGFQE